MDQAGLRVMTFNLRFENDRDGPNAWAHRKEMAAALIDRYCPDILGTQEGKWPQLLYLADMLPEYRLCVDGRPFDPKVQCPTLFVRKRRFQILAHDDIWLSETPDIYLSKSWDSAFPRMMSYCRMSDATGNLHLYAAVTHLDHMGAAARVNQARIIASWARQMPGPVILMGDFNEAPASDVHRILTAPETQLFDTWQALEKPEDETAYTHHGFTGKPQRARMDWILADASFRVTDARILRDAEGGAYPSDHFPCMADLVAPGAAYAGRPAGLPDDLT